MNAIWSTKLRMKRIFEYIRLVFISFEFLYALFVIVVAIRFPSLLVGFGAVLRSDPEVLKWIPVIPIALCGVIFNLAWRLTAPASGSNRTLYEWPEYWRLTCRRDVSIILSGIVALVALCLWVFSSHLTNLQLGITFAIALGVGIIDAACLTFASFKIKELTEE
jgi:multidrug transporter EmrE-like cation transporter